MKKNIKESLKIKKKKVKKKNRRYSIMART